MHDTTGISLSVSDPDNDNHPQAYGDGGAGDAQDYCSAELMYGDNLSNLLDAATPAGNARVMGGGAKAMLAKKKNCSPCSKRAPYLVIAAVIGLVFVALVVTNGE